MREELEPGTSPDRRAPPDAPVDDELAIPAVAAVDVEPADEVEPPPDEYEDEDEYDEGLAPWRLDEPRVDDGSLIHLHRLNASGPVSFGSGHVAARDVNILYRMVGGEPATPRPVSGPVHESILDRLAETYVEVTAFARLREGLRRQHVQVLRGYRGSGRMTTALLALRGLSKSVNHLGASQAHSLVSASVADGSGYVAEPTEGPVTPALLSALGERLREQHAYLVLLTDEALDLDESTSSEYVLRYAHPSGEQVFHRHFEQVAVDRDREFLGQPGVKSAIFDEARQAAGPAQVVRLVNNLVVAAGEDRTAEQFLSGLESRLRTGVRRWLLGEPPGIAATDSMEGWSSAPPGSNAGVAGPQRTLWEVATLLACCVLDGYPLGRVVAEAERLAVRLHEIESPGTRPPHPVLRDSVQACITFIRVAEPHEPGSDWLARWHTPRVWVRDPKTPRIVFEILWREFIAARGPVVGWLREMTDPARGRSSTRGSGKCAIATIGMLATIDFDYLYRALLGGWAGSRDERLNEAAVRALEVAASDERVASTVRLALRRWSDPKSARFRRRTAMLAYRSGIGAHFPGDALRAVRGMTGNADRRQARVLLTGLVLAGHADRVLAQLAGPDGGDPEAVGLFLALGDVDGDADIPDPRGALLASRATVPGGDRALSRLWTLALRDSSTTTAAWRRLREWVALADDQPELLASLGTLATDLMVDANLAVRLPFVLKLWHGDRSQPWRATAWLLARVSRA